MADFDEEKQDKRLEELRKHEEEKLVELLAGKYGIPSINLRTLLIENEALRTVPEDEARRLEVAPFKILGRQVHIALRAPERPEVKDLIARLQKKGFVVFPYMASQESLSRVWDRYKELSFAAVSRAGGVALSTEAIGTIRGKVRSLDDITAILDNSLEGNGVRNTTELLEIIIGSATAIGASDVHIEPEKDDIKVRFRLDGVLNDIFRFGYGPYKLVNSRIKLLSGLKLTVSDSEQDGRFSIFIEDDEVNIRTSVVPGAYGESIVLRILDPKATKVHFEDLGVEPRLFAVLDREIKKPNGLMLITGPTGSGKTTTLYSFLRRIYSPGTKIITIEDPVEYHLEGITQTQVEEERGYTFLEGLRGALRQDPDVIMVGEIRDEETAKIAINAALTGHLVLSTLHTNNAAGVIPRLIDLGVNPKILTSALTVSVAQRLVRKLCPSCKKRIDPSMEEKSLIETILDGIRKAGIDISGYGIPEGPVSLFKAAGCDECHQTGYRGRIGIFEAIKTDEAIESVATENPSEREIARAAAPQGILDMREDGVLKALAGTTSLEEVRRVVDLGDA